MRLPVILLLIALPSLTIGQTFTYVETESDGVSGVDGIDGATFVAISPNYKYLYTTSDVEDAITVFWTDFDGTMQYAQSIFDDGNGGSVDGLDGVKGIDIAPDGKSAYVVSSEDDAVVAFSRDRNTGVLTYVETQKDGVSSVDGLDGACDVAVSPDNKHVYAVSAVDDAIAVFSRTVATSALTYVEVHKDGVSSVDGMDGARRVFVAPDGGHVYVASSDDNSIAVFSRNSTTGALTYVEKQTDGVSSVDGLAGAYDVVVTPDDDHVYAVGKDDDAVVVFSRNTGTGALTYVENHKDNSSGGSITTLDSPMNLSISLGGDYLVVSSGTEDGFSNFTVNSTSGALTYADEYVDGSGTNDGLDGASGIVFGLINNVFVTGTDEDGFSSWGLTSALPVEFSSFRGVRISDCEIELQWTTASEINNMHFEVQSSRNGKAWDILEIIEGAGNSVTELQYSSRVDIDGEMKLFRIRQVDFDGRANHTESISFTCESEVEFLAYPNPIENELNISTSLDGEFQIFDISGRIAESGKIWSESLNTIDLNSLPSGVYIMNANVGGKLHTERIIKK